MSLTETWGNNKRLTECPREVKHLCLRFPTPDECELVIVADGREKVYELSRDQVALLAFQSVSELTK